MANKLGRPTKYTEEYCDKLLAFFDIDSVRMTVEKFYYKNGDVKEKEIEVPNELPLISMFERQEGLGIGRCSKWAKAKNDDGTYKYPIFRQAYKEAKALQENMWVNNSLRGLYSGAFTIFAGKNMFGWRDKQEIDHTSKGEKIAGINYVVPKEPA